ncbi:hypothetical protein SRHO_G00047220 [Serrasalmus rhombeus]
MTGSTRHAGALLPGPSPPLIVHEGAGTHFLLPRHKLQHLLEIYCITDTDRIEIRKEDITNISREPGSQSACCTLRRDPDRDEVVQRRAVNSYQSFTQILTTTSIQSRLPAEDRSGVDEGETSKSCAAPAERAV